MSTKINVIHLKDTQVNPARQSFEHALGEIPRFVLPGSTVEIPSRTQINLGTQNPPYMYPSVKTPGQFNQKKIAAYTQALEEGSLEELAFYMSYKQTNVCVALAEFNDTIYYASNKTLDNDTIAGVGNRNTEWSQYFSNITVTDRSWQELKVIICQSLALSGSEFKLTPNEADAIARWKKTRNCSEYDKFKTHSERLNLPESSVRMMYELTQWNSVMENNINTVGKHEIAFQEQVRVCQSYEIGLVNNKKAIIDKFNQNLVYFQNMKRCAVIYTVLSSKVIKRLRFTQWLWSKFDLLFSQALRYDMQQKGYRFYDKNFVVVTYSDPQEALVNSEDLHCEQKLSILFNNQELKIAVAKPCCSTCTAFLLLRNQTANQDIQHIVACYSSSVCGQYMGRVVFDRPNNQNLQVISYEPSQGTELL